MSSASIIEILLELHENRDFYFVVDQNIIKENVFGDQLGNYRKCNIIEDYYVDIEVDEITTINNTVTPKDKELFFESIKEKHEEKTLKKKKVLQ